MKSTTLSQHSCLTAVSAVTAAIAALALTACGPRDSVETAPPATAAPATAQMQTAAAEPAPLVRGQGIPVPPATNPTYSPPAPVTVARARPGDPTQPSYPAQSNYRPQPDPAGYAPQPNYVVERPAAETPAVDRGRIGSVASIEPIRERPQGTGAGAVIGGVLGAVVGNQFGHGAGRAGMTGAGAIGGAIAGNNLERNHRETITGYRVGIRLDNGTTRSFERTQIGGLHVGDRVRLDAGTFHGV